MRQITIIALALLSVSGSAWADELNFRWQNPVNLVTGELITDPITVAVHREGADPVQLQDAYEAGSIGDLTMTVPCGIYQYHITATVNGITSSASQPKALGYDCAE